MLVKRVMLKCPPKVHTSKVLHLPVRNYRIKVNVYSNILLISSKMQMLSFMIGMTQHQQIDLLKMFREGGHKLIVATSVAQEGLDIEKCNVVVRYNFISSVVAHVQTRGKKLHSLSLWLRECNHTHRERTYYRIYYTIILYIHMYQANLKSFIIFLNIIILTLLVYFTDPFSRSFWFQLSPCFHKAKHIPIAFRESRFLERGSWWVELDDSIYYNFVFRNILISKRGYRCRLLLYGTNQVTCIFVCIPFEILMPPLSNECLYLWIRIINFTFPFAYSCSQVNKVCF